MLLARLQREPAGRCPARIDGNTDQPAGKRTFIGVLDCDVAGMRAAITHRHSKTLHRADRDIGAEFIGRRQKRQRQRIGRENRKAAFGPDLADRPTRPALRHMEHGDGVPHGLAPAGRA